GANGRHAEAFARFWAAYPKRKAKARAEAAFRKLAPDDDLLAAMLAAIERQRASGQWQRESGRFIPYPASWLNGRCWDDDPDPEPTADAEPDYDAAIRALCPGPSLEAEAAVFSDPAEGARWLAEQRAIRNGKQEVTP
ncbi:MAG TPA: hypothetical protein PKZ08_16585, partial [Vicinamibacterales bacterium]|nr:hypothetical protein [Vicinamibacterales bacterium]